MIQRFKKAIPDALAICLMMLYCWWQGVDQEAANRVEVIR